MVEIESARTKTGDARLVTAGPLPTTVLIDRDDIALSASRAHQDSSKVGTDISP
jgi:hypothetical protein